MWVNLEAQGMQGNLLPSFSGNLIRRKRKSKKLGGQWVRTKAGLTGHMEKRSTIWTVNWVAHYQDVTMPHLLDRPTYLLLMKLVHLPAH